MLRHRVSFVVYAWWPSRIWFIDTSRQMSFWGYWQQQCRWTLGVRAGIGELQKIFSLIIHFTNPACAVSQTSTEICLSWLKFNSHKSWRAVRDLLNNWYPPCIMFVHTSVYCAIRSVRIIGSTDFIECSMCHCEISTIKINSDNWKAEWSATWSRIYIWSRNLIELHQWA